MSETVRCPECDAVLKLKSSSKSKARCPRCKSVIDLEAIRSSGAKEPRPPKKRSGAGASPEPETGGWDDDLFEDEFDDYEDYEEEMPVRKPKKKSGKSLKRRKQASNGPMLSEETRQQVMSFGWLLVGLGVAAFVLPFVGLQIKGLHALGAEGQMLGGGLLIGVGVFMLVISALGDIGVSIFGFVKWGLIGIVGLSFAFCIGCTGVIHLMEFFKAAPQPVAPRNVPMQQQPGFAQGRDQPNRAAPRPGFPIPSFQSRIEQQFSEYSDSEILNLELHGFNPAEQRQMNARIRGVLGTRLSMATNESGVYKIRLAPVSGDLQAVADQLDFIAVTSTDPANRRIVAQKKN